MVALDTADVVVILGGFGLIVGIAWFFWGPRQGGYRATPTSRGYQEAMILVKGGYTPDVIVVERGRPVRLSFRREETAACTEMVIFDAFGKSASLPTGQTVPVEFLPEKPGEYEFTCGMGMIRGKVIVE
jgi:plastocyanin domain-containing protein